MSYFLEERKEALQKDWDKAKKQNINDRRQKREDRAEESRSRRVKKVAGGNSRGSQKSQRKGSVEPQDIQAESSGAGRWCLKLGPVHRPPEPHPP